MGNEMSACWSSSDVQILVACNETAVWLAHVAN